MNRRPTAEWWSGAVMLAILAGTACRPTGNAVLLPALVPYPNLPVAFGRTLQERHDRAATTGHNPAAVRKLACLYHANRLFTEARACYELIGRVPADLTTRDHYHLADIARHQNDLERAGAELRVVVSVEPEYLPARLALADVLFKTGQQDAAAVEYVAVLAFVPDQPQASLGLARIDLQRGDEDSAVNRLEELMAAHPGSTAGAALLAQVLRRRGDTDRAVALAELSQRRPEPGPADPWRAELLADVFDLQLLGLEAEDCFRTGQVDAALAHLRRIEELDPTSPVPPLLRGQAEALAHRDEAAVLQFREALARGSDPEKVVPCIAQSLLALNKTAEAASFLADYDKKYPESVPIAKAYADALVRKGDDRAARPVLARVLQADPHLREQSMELARILWDANERDAAAEILQRVASDHADDIPSRALLGEYHLEKSDPFSAIAPLEQALALATPRTPVYDRLGGLLASACLKAGSGLGAQGKLAEAADNFERATRIVPNDPSAFVALAQVCVQLKQYSRAAAALERLARLQPENPTILLSLGDVLFRHGDQEAARQRWQQALHLLASGDAALRQALEERLRGESSGDLPP